MLDKQPATLAPPLDLSKYPQDHIPLLLNSIICELLLDFTRTLDKRTGQHVWTGNGLDGSSTHELFDFVQNDGLAVDMAYRFALANSLGFQLTTIPAIDIPEIGRKTPAQVHAFLLRIGPNGEGIPFSQTSGFRIGATVALLIATQLGADIPQRHRTLFPAHYMAIVK